MSDINENCDEINNDDMEEVINDISTSNENLVNLDSQTKKRMRGSSDEEWTEVTRKSKKLKDKNKIEVYISSKEKLPKQFNLAKIFRDQNIKDIMRLKFINPYRVRIELGSEISAEKLETCKYFLDQGWNIHRAMENSMSYGVIRDVDLELTDENILENIFCPEPAKLISVLRLNRKNFGEDGWSPSEAVRLGFKGSFLPPYVYTHDLRIKVEPYVFPVSQCSRCWRFGHIHKKCPSTKVICPKCGKNHENCETTDMRCVNCGGEHISLSKACPRFQKEKRLRELMAEFNCTYRKALTMYIPKDEPTSKEMNMEILRSETQPALEEEDLTFPTNISSPVLQITTKAQIHKKKEKSFTKQKLKKEDKTQVNFMQWLEEEQHNNTERKNSDETEAKQKEVTFKELLLRLREDKIHIAVLSETWLEPDSNFKVKGYNIFRKDRYDAYGGVAILTHKSVKSQICHNFQHSNPGIEIIHVKVYNCNQIENIVSIYCPPSINTSQADWEQLFIQNVAWHFRNFDGTHHHIISKFFKVKSPKLKNKYVVLKISLFKNFVPVLAIIQLKVNYGVE
ncbi:hypothetical protein HW555_013009 [Spodoptera exigua]|uniref:CCHC-type domain-containing protein n=1 Tax=Spodoptera exigua TaxID=7107 RepID=A0A835G5I0_SPOEX|nr:hypothetical protein HW555_013009 [Spodoptera exigua]